MNNNFNNLQSGMMLKCNSKKGKDKLTTMCHDVLRMAGLWTFRSPVYMSLEVQYNYLNKKNK